MMSLSQKLFIICNLSWKFFRQITKVTNLKLKTAFHHISLTAGTIKASI